MWAQCKTKHLSYYYFKPGSSLNVYSFFGGEGSFFNDNMNSGIFLEKVIQDYRIQESNIINYFVHLGKGMFKLKEY